MSFFFIISFVVIVLSLVAKLWIKMPVLELKLELGFKTLVSTLGFYSSLVADSRVSSKGNS